MSPTNPGTTPIIEGGLEVVQIAMQQNSHNKHLRECKEHKRVNNAIKQLTIGSFEEKYSRRMKNT